MTLLERVGATPVIIEKIVEFRLRWFRHVREKTCICCSTKNRFNKG